MGATVTMAVRDGQDGMRYYVAKLSECYGGKRRKVMGAFRFDIYVLKFGEIINLVETRQEGM